MTFNYRGSWGSPGSYRFAQNLEDADAVLAYLREPANAAKLRIDTKTHRPRGAQHGRMGNGDDRGHDHGLAGVILISAADMGQLGKMEHERLVAEMADNMEGLAGVTAESMANEDAQNAQGLRICQCCAWTQGCAHACSVRRMMGSRRRPTPVQAIQAEGGHNVKVSPRCNRSWLVRSPHLSRKHDHRVASTLK